MCERMSGHAVKMLRPCVGKTVFTSRVRDTVFLWGSDEAYNAIREGEGQMNSEGHRSD